jgi:CO/xanthine dehydrogenase Mo-binding subunit
VLTAADIGAIPVITMRQELLPEYAHFQQPVIARNKVRYVGEPVAVVVADRAALAEDALDAIALDIEPLPAVASRAASRADASLLFEERGSNLVGTLTALRGDANAAFRDAPYVRRERFEVQRFTAVPMEPRGLLAEWDAARGHLTVHGAAKVAFHNRVILAKQLGLAEDAVTMIEADVGGGFGVRGEFYPEDFLIPFAARALGRPVKWIEDRREHLLATNHARDASPATATARSAACAVGARSILAPTSAPTASPRRATPRKSCRGPIAFPASTTRLTFFSPTRRRPALTVARAASRRTSSASGCSTSWRASLASTGSNSGGAT